MARGHLRVMQDDALRPPPVTQPTGYVALHPRPGRKALGWGFIVLGVLGLVLPFLQGFLFLALGVFVLRDQYVWAADRWAWVAGKWPGMTGAVESLEGRVSAKLSDWGARLRGMIGRR